MPMLSTPLTKLAVNLFGGMEQVATVCRPFRMSPSPTQEHYKRLLISVDASHTSGTCTASWSRRVRSGSNVMGRGYRYALCCAANGAVFGGDSGGRGGPRAHVHCTCIAMWQVHSQLNPTWDMCSPLCPFPIWLYTYHGICTSISAHSYYTQLITHDQRTTPMLLERTYL